MNTQKTVLALLVAYLSENGGWPEKVTHIGQDYDRELMFFGRGNARTGIILDELAIDHRKRGEAGVKITRDQYEAALAASKELRPYQTSTEHYTADVGAGKTASATTDGWIDWHGGECPVDVDTLVEVQLRNPGNYHKCMPTRADSWDWGNDGVDGDIIAYRLHQPQDANSRANDDRLAQHAAAHAGFASTSRDEETDLNDCIGQASAEEWKPYVNAEIEWNEGRRWFPGTVIAITDEWIIIKDKHGNEGSYLRDVLSIRPIDFERNDMAEIIKTAAEKYQGLAHINKFIADELYAAGYRKQ